MTEYSGPFESSGDGIQEADWLILEDAIYPYSGYVANYGGELAVSQHAAGAAMSVDVAAGAAVVKSSRYRNSAVKTMTIEAADAAQDRYDLIVVQRTLAAPASTTVIAVHKGSLYAAGTAVAPSPTQSSTVWEIVLAQVFVEHGTTAITTAMITDERDSANCGAYAPAVGGLTVLPASGNFDFDGKKIVNVGAPSASTDADTVGARNTAIAALSMAGRLIGITTITATGAGTYVASANATKVRIRLEGGGGGAGESAGAESYKAGGGGAGAYIEWYVSVTGGSSYSLTVGAGGAGGATPGASGSNGSDTAITIGANTATAGGGTGGTGGAASGAPGGAGGAASGTGSLKCPGAAGSGGDLSRGAGGAARLSGHGGEPTTTTGGDGGNGCIVIEEYA